MAQSSASNPSPKLSRTICRTATVTANGGKYNITIVPGAARLISSNLSADSSALR